ncbi:MAG: amidohydrolase family protein [Acidimicrobiia bacterium]
MATLQHPIEYRVVDADNHYYEPLDVFERYIDPRYRARTFTVHDTDDGYKEVRFDGRPFGFVGGAGQRQRVRPGALRARLRGEQPNEEPEFDDSYAAEPAARLQLMDAQGIEATWMYPSTGVTLENLLVDDPELLMAHFDALRRWLDETWGFANQNRIFSAVPLTLIDVDFAVAQLEAALAAGARVIQLLPGPGSWGRSPADPIYDPFWSRVNEAGALVTFHLGNSGYMERYSGDWGENPDPDGVKAASGWRGTGATGPDNKGHGRSSFQWMMYYRDRPIMETIANLMYNNFFGRFPNINVASVENGAIWVPYLLAVMDNMKGMGRNGPWPNGYVSGKFSDIFRERVFVSPHHFTEDIGALIELIGASQVLFGSDFPHAEGMSGVDDYRDRTAELVARANRSEDEIRMFLRDNALGLLGVPT